MKLFLVKLSKINASSWIIIVGIFITSIAKCMVIPFFAVYLVQHMHFSVAAAGVAIAARTFGQRGLVLIGGPFVDWLGPKTVIGVGLLLMAISYLFTAYSQSISAIVFWTLALGLGGAFYTPAIKSAMVNETSYSERIFILSLRSTALNVGSALGPVLGAMIFIISPKMIFITTAIIIFFLALISQLVVKIPSNKDKKLALKLSDVYILFKNPAAWKLIIFTVLFYTFFIQLELTYPIFAAETFHAKTVGYLFLLNAIIIIAFQMPLSNWITKASIDKVFLIGMSTLGLGLLVTTFSYLSLSVFYIAIAVFSFGEILILPKLDAEVSLSVSQNVVGTAFGVLGGASAVGAIIGGILGGNVFHAITKNFGVYYYWLSLGVVLILITLLIAVMQYVKRINPLSQKFSREL